MNSLNTGSLIAISLITISLNIRSFDTRILSTKSLCTKESNVYKYSLMVVHFELGLRTIEIDLQSKITILSID